MSAADMPVFAMLGLFVWFIVKPAGTSVRILGSAVLAGLIVGWIAAGAGW